MDRADLWLGLPGHRTSPQWTSSYEATLSSWFTRRQLILKRVLLSGLLRQQQPSGNNLAFLRARVSLCCVVVGCVSRSVPVHSNICSKLEQNTIFFFSILQWFCLISNFRPNLTVRSAARTPLRHIVPWQQIFVLVPPITSRSLGIEFFRTLCKKNCVINVRIGTSTQWQTTV